ncbi:hypothetical protein [Curtobacterium sp. VKM Ac-1376]|uniref:MmyB family transcriptional regulator n=1 Tax=Curtobacterium sp. VKM Ac-1376 TaxID=123312 RepID=UPI003A5C7411
MFRMSADPTDGRMHEILGSLSSRYTDFAEVWSRYDVSTPTHGHFVQDVSPFGRLQFDWELLELPGSAADSPSHRCSRRTRAPPRRSPSSTPGSAPVLRDRHPRRPRRPRRPDRRAPTGREARYQLAPCLPSGSGARPGHRQPAQRVGQGEGKDPGIRRRLRWLRSDTRPVAVPRRTPLRCHGAARGDRGWR